MGLVTCVSSPVLLSSKSITSKRSSNIPVLNSWSDGVSAVSEGEAFTSMSHGLSCHDTGVMVSNAGEREIFVAAISWQMSRMKHVHKCQGKQQSRSISSQTRV